MKVKDAALRWMYYWEYVLNTTRKEIEAYKKLYGDRYEGTIEAKTLEAREQEALTNLEVGIHV